MAGETGAPWGAAFRVAASQKWRRQSAAMGGGVTQAMVRLAAARPGMRVLDLACGTGEPAISLGGEVGSAGRVAAIDLNGELLQVARGRAAQRGFDHLSFQQADAHALPFAGASFDLVTSRFGVMLAALLPEHHRGGDAACARPHAQAGRAQHVPLFASRVAQRCFAAGRVSAS
jgi:SAM-dependent methyltransferase